MPQTAVRHGGSWRCQVRETAWRNSGGFTAEVSASRELITKAPSVFEAPVGLLQKWSVPAVTAVHHVQRKLADRHDAVRPPSARRSPGLGRTAWQGDLNAEA